MKEHSLGPGLYNFVNVAFLKHGLAVNNNLVALNRHNFAGILVNKIFNPCLEHTGGKLAADILLEVGLINLYLLCKAENLNNVLIRFKAYGTEKSCYG